MNSAALNLALVVTGLSFIGFAWLFFWVIETHRRQQKKMSQLFRGLVCLLAGILISLVSPFTMFLTRGNDHLAYDGVLAGALITCIGALWAIIPFTIWLKDDLLRTKGRSRKVSLYFIAVGIFIEVSVHTLPHTGFHPLIGHLFLLAGSLLLIRSFRRDTSDHLT